MLLCLYVKSKTLRRSIAKESCLKQMNVNLVSCNPSCLQSAVKSDRLPFWETAHLPLPQANILP